MKSKIVQLVVTSLSSEVEIQKSHTSHTLSVWLSSVILFNCCPSRPEVLLEICLCENHNVQVAISK